MMLDLSRISWKLGVLACIAFVASISWILIDYVRILRLRRKMPPGPVPIPLIGNWFNIPKEKPWIEFENMSKTYDSPMVTLWNGRKPTIICNDAWTISDLLEKRAALYSSRPHMVVMGDMMNQTDANQTCQIYGDQWRTHRRLMVSCLQAIRVISSGASNEVSILLSDPRRFATIAHSKGTSPKYYCVIFWKTRTI